MGQGYQDRDYEIIDYKLYNINSKIKRPFRGPRLGGLSKGEYIVCIGAAQTFGCYVEEPYPYLLHEELKIPVLNLGVAGAGPSFFNKRKELLELINNSKFAIVQVMSGRSVSNSEFVSNGGEMLTRISDNMQLGAAPCWNGALKSHSPEQIKALVEETRNNWVKDTITLLENIKVPKISFWFSERTTDYKESYNNVSKLFGKYPQFVNNEMVETIKPFSDFYIESISSKGMPQVLYSRFTGDKTNIHTREDLGNYKKEKNDYYPSPEMHKIAFTKLNSCLKMNRFITSENTIETSIKEDKSKFLRKFPKHIVQYWNTDNIPEDIYLLMNTWQEMNPEYEYTLFNRDRAIDFLEINYSDEVTELFKCINIPAMQSDFFRVAYILKEGGIYIDAYTQCIKSLNELVNIDTKLILIKKYNNRIINGFIACNPDNKILTRIFDEILLNINKGKIQNIWLSTGPGLFMKIIESLDSTLKDSLTLIDQKPYGEKYFLFKGNPLHKNGSHWSILQENIDLYKDFKVFYTVENLFSFKKKDMATIKKKIIIHMGQHKTGSTALQRLMVSDNKHKYLYPKTGLKFSAHNEMYNVLKTADNHRIYDLMNALLKEINESNASVVVLSNEFFSSTNELSFNKIQMFRLWKNLQAFMELFEEQEIVFYIREQADSIESRINQAIKSRISLDTLDLKAILENPSLDYSLFMKLLDKYFPNAKIIPRIYDTSLFENSDIGSDFSSTFLNTSLSCKKSNPRIHFIDQVLLFMRINSLDISIDEKMDLKNKFKNYKGKKIKSTILTEDEVEYIRQNYKQSNVDFFKKYPEIGVFKYNFSSNEQSSISERVITKEKLNSLLQSLGIKVRDDTLYKIENIV